MPIGATTEQKKAEGYGSFDVSAMDPERRARLQKRAQEELDMHGRRFETTGSGNGTLEHLEIPSISF